MAKAPGEDPFPTLYGDDVEAAGPIPQIEASEVGPCGARESPTLVSIHRRRGAAEEIAASGLDLDKDDLAPALHYQVELAAAALPVSVSEPVAPDKQQQQCDALGAAAESVGRGRVHGRIV